MSPPQPTRARERVVAHLLAAAWRENLGGLRDTAQRDGATFRLRVSGTTPTDGDDPSPSTASARDHHGGDSATQDDAGHDASGTIHIADPNGDTAPAADGPDDAASPADGHQPANVAARHGANHEASDTVHISPSKADVADTDARDGADGLGDTTRAAASNGSRDGDAPLPADGQRASTAARHGAKREASDTIHIGSSRAEADACDNVDGLDDKATNAVASNGSRDGDAALPADGQRANTAARHGTKREASGTVHIGSSRADPAATACRDNVGRPDDTPRPADDGAKATSPGGGDLHTHGTVHSGASRAGGSLPDDGRSAARRDGAVHVGQSGTFLTTAVATDELGHEMPAPPVHHDGVHIDHPARLLRLLVADAPAQLAAELGDAVDGLDQALPRHARRCREVAEAAVRRGVDSSVALAEKLRRDGAGFVPCRFFEPLAVDGHHLHPCARTRLGWDGAARRAFDVRRELAVSAPDPRGRDLGTLLAQRFEELEPYVDDERLLIPVHPWQHASVLTGRHRDLFDSADVIDLPVSLPTSPTASVRTLVTDAGDYLKCSLSIHITSTSRGISPATVHNGPRLSPVLTEIIGADPVLAQRIAILPELAGASLPHGHPAARDLSCLLRGGLDTVTEADELPVPATALPAISPVTGTTVAAELAAARPEAFLRRYADLLITATTHLAARYGIAAEAHLQNCLPTFAGGMPRRIIVRDLGGARILPDRLAAAGHRPDLHPASVTVTRDPDVLRTKIAYTVIHNHLSALVGALHRDRVLAADDAWRIVADTMDATDLPAADRAFYTAATLPLKALLTMRVNGSGDLHVGLPNPLARP
jgi:hypothetical protein